MIELQAKTLFMITDKKCINYLGNRHNRQKRFYLNFYITITIF